MIGKIMDDNQLIHLVEEIDNKLIEWGTLNKIPPTSLAGVILGRLVIMARQTNCVEDLSMLLNNVKETLLDKPKDIIH
jgi:hypothetical protein